jgi:hypothetical protein
MIRRLTRGLYCTVSCLEDSVRFLPFKSSIALSRRVLAVRRAQESQPLDAEIIAKRTKRHLDELEVRSCTARFRSIIS